MTDEQTPPQDDEGQNVPPPPGDEQDGDEGQNVPPPPGDEQDGDESDLQQTFNRDYVEKLRTKSAGYRMRAKEAEQTVESLQRQLHRERVQALGTVIDPDQVPYDAEHLDDGDALEQAVEALLESKPYLRKRKPAGDIGQHTSDDRAPAFSLLGALRDNA